MSLIEPIPVPRVAARALRVEGAPARPKAPAPGSERLRARLVRADRLDPADRRRWATLGACAAQGGNLFAADWLMAPALAAQGRWRDVRLAVVEDAAGGWLGMLPLVRGRLPGRAGLPVWRAWASPFGEAGTPLLRPGAERAFWEALLARLDRRPGLAAGLLADPLPLEEPATLALASIAAEQGRALHRLAACARPARIAGAERDPRAQRITGRWLDRLEARLSATHGRVRMVLHQHAEDCEPWLGAFLALRRAGTGAGASVDPGLLRAAIREGHRRGAVRLASLTAGETIVAMAGWLVAGRCGHALGTAHDARLAGFAPHRLLERRVASLAVIEGLERFDGAPAGPLCPDTRAFAGFVVPIGGQRRRALLAPAFASVGDRQSLG